MCSAAAPRRCRRCSSRSSRWNARCSWPLAIEVARGAVRFPSPALLAQLVEHFHGKEGVVGSSPTEGSLENPANRPFCALPRPIAVRNDLLSCGRTFPYLSGVVKDG